MAGHFNPDVNPRLLKLIESLKYDKYGVRPISGYRPGDPRQHGRGQAIDVELFDPKTQAALANYQDPSTFGAYQEYANAVYQQALQSDPELAKQLRWGGYFSGGKGKYGALDLMHFDTAGEQIPMGGGSWAGGLNPEQAKIWNLQAGGGVGGASGQQQGPPAPPQDPHQAFIYNMWPLAVQQSQLTGVDPRIIMAQTIQETGWGKSAPNNNYFGVKGPSGGNQKTLEFINGRMQPVEASFRGYDDANQSFEDYGKLLMGDRYKGLREAKGLEAQAAALQASGYATDPNYGSSILQIAQGIPEGGYPSGASPASPTSPATAKPDTAIAKTTETWKDKFRKGAGEAFKGLGDMGGGGGVTPTGITDTPKAALAANTPTLTGVSDPQAADLQRQKLAQMMARLNSQKLWV